MYISVCVIPCRYCQSMSALFLCNLQYQCKYLYVYFNVGARSLIRGFTGMVVDAAFLGGNVFGGE